MRAALVLIAIVLFSGPARADQHTGNHLYLDCNGGRAGVDPNIQDMRCGSFLYGFIVMQAAGERLGQRPIFCVPVGTMMKQHLLIFIDWAERNAEHLHQPVGWVLLAAMKEAFPCPAG